VAKQVGGIFVDAVSPGAFELLEPVSARQQTNPEHPCPARRQEIPDAVTYNDRLFYRNPEPLGRRKEKVGIRLRMSYLIARDYGDAFRDVEEFDRRPGALRIPAGGDRPRDAPIREVAEKLTRSRERTDLAGSQRIGGGVEFPQLNGILWSDFSARLPEQCGCEQPAAHSYLPVDPPHRQVGARAFQGVLPRKDVLVDAIDERPIQVEEECGARGSLLTSMRR